MAQHSRKNAQFQAVTANKLSDGEVVYATQKNNQIIWNEKIEEASIADPQQAPQLLHNALNNAEAVIEPYLFEIKQLNGKITPISEREIIRAKGPTVRLDLGKQAQKQ